MTILTTTENIAVCADERDILKGIRHYYIFSRGKTYDVEDDFFSVPTPDMIRRSRLREDKITEYFNVLAETDDAWDKRHAELSMTSNTHGLSDRLNEMLVSVLAEQSAEAIFTATMPMVRDRIIKEFGILPQIHEIKTPLGSTRITGVTHEKFETVLNLVNLDVPVFLTGAAGTGKNVICKQVAESLNLDFYFTNAVTQEYKLTGFIDANGTFHETQFYKAFKNGGLFFLDEMDGSIPEVLIMLNAAIANRYFDFPNGKVEAHENFRVIAAGNTFGTGADIEYTGRYQLDAASLDRFALVEVDYSPRIEEAISEGDNELCDFIRSFRQATVKVGIKHLATYRSIDRIHKLAQIMSLEEALKVSLLKNLRNDDINIISREMDLKHNKYFDAMESITSMRIG